MHAIVDAGIRNNRYTCWSPTPAGFLNHQQKSQSSPCLANRAISSALTFKTLPENSRHFLFIIRSRNLLSLFNLPKEKKKNVIFFSIQQSFLYYFCVFSHLPLNWAVTEHAGSTLLLSLFFLFAFQSPQNVTRGRYPQAFANGILAAQLDPIYYPPFIESCGNPLSLPLSSKDTVLRGESRGCK